MTSTQLHGETAIEASNACTVDMKLEVVVIPISDVDRAKRFYGSLSWRRDADIACQRLLTGAGLASARKG